MIFDVLIVGGGPAGLSAALVLGRCCRKVALFDTSEPRNYVTKHIYGLLGHDTIDPAMYRKMGKEEVLRYGVKVFEKKIIKAVCENGHFAIETAEKETFLGKKLLLATGICDNLPGLEGFSTYYGKGVYHCPYCDGYEYHGKVLAAWGKGSEAFGLALALKGWSEEVSLFLDKNSLNTEMTTLLQKNKISVYTSKVERLEGDSERLKEIVLKDGKRLKCDALFFVNGYQQHSDLAKMLNCRFTKKGVVHTSVKQETNINGLYVAGDAAKDMQMTIVAAAEGAKAAIAINTALQLESWK